MLSISRYISPILHTGCQKLITQSHHTSTRQISTLFHSRATSHTDWCLRKLSTQTSAESDHAGKSKRSDKTAEEHLYGFLGLIGGSIGTLGAIFLYVYSNAPDKKWNVFLRDLQETMAYYKRTDLNKEIEDVKLAKEIHKALVALKNKLSEKDLDELIKHLIDKADKIHDQNLSDLKQQHQKEMNDLMATHATDKQKALDALKLEQQQAIVTLEEAHNKMMANGRESADQLRQQIELYQEAAREEDSSCALNLRGFLLGRDVIDLRKQPTAFFQSKSLRQMCTVLKHNLNGSIRTLECYGTNIKVNAAFQQIMASLSTNQSVRVLHIGYTALGRSDPHMDDINALVAMLASNRSVEEIDLSWNYIDDAMAEKLMVAVKANGVVKKLNLYKTNVNDPMKQTMRSTLNIEVL